MPSKERDSAWERKIDEILDELIRFEDIYQAKILTEMKKSESGMLTSDLLDLHRERDEACDAMYEKRMELGEHLKSVDYHFSTIDSLIKNRRRVLGKPAPI